MAEVSNRISSFCIPFVAFYRPKKRSYFILEWSPTYELWTRYNEDHPLLTLHKTRNHGDGTCKMRVQKGRIDHNEIRVRGDGHFLKAGHLNIPILHKIYGNITNGSMAREYTVNEDNALNYQVHPYFQDINLWMYEPIPLPSIEPEPPILHIEPIPQRIAKLLAESSISKEEVCPITMESMNLSNVAVTSCFHVFSADSLEGWFDINLNKPQCPVCRKSCKATNIISSLT